MGVPASRLRLHVKPLLFAAAMVIPMAAFTTPAMAQTTTTPAASSESPGPTEPAPLPLPESGTQSIIPIPNSGPGPQNEGDPGTASQYIVMGMTFGGIAAIIALIARESRKKRTTATDSASDVPKTNAG